jgi:hypothetical protein
VTAAPSRRKPEGPALTRPHGAGTILEVARPSGRLSHAWLGYAVILALGCGGEVTSSERADAGSCLQLDGHRRAAATQITCACSSGATGSTVCVAGAWTPCTCAGAAQGGGVAGGTSVTTNPTPPSVCGNARVEYGELCDGRDLNGETCSTATLYSLPLGTLGCTASCTFDTHLCTSGRAGSAGAGGGTGAGGARGAGAAQGAGASPGAP